VTKFDWIDFGYSWKDKWPEKPVDKEFHSSTSSLLSKKLRGREFERRKIFLWMRRDDAFETAETDGVSHVEAKFPFQTYVGSGKVERLKLFCSWMTSSISRAFPKLLSAGEREEIEKWIEKEGYTYTRIENVPIKTGGVGRCKVVFEHSPDRVEAQLTCPDSTETFDLPKNLYRRDELDYAKSVISCSIENGRICVDTSKGVVRDLERIRLRLHHSRPLGRS
jgi:hypothetical protein